MGQRGSGFGLAVAFVGVVTLVVPHVVLAQDAGPPPPAPSVQQGGSIEATAPDPPTESSGADQTGRGFWATFGHTTPLGVATRTPGEAGFFGRTGEGIKRIWSDGRPTFIASGYAWHLPWKHKTERQKAFNDAAWGAGFGYTFAENDHRQRTLYFLANNDSYEKLQYFVGYAWQARWHPHGTLRLGAGYTIFLIGRNEYYYVPAPLILPAFSAGTDAVDLMATYVPYGEVVLLVGRFTF